MYPPHLSLDDKLNLEAVLKYLDTFLFYLILSVISCKQHSLRI